MALSIRITSTPEGTAPEHIRKQWIGVEIPLASDEDIAVDPPRGGRPEEGYLVLRDTAIEVLENAGLFDAAHYWRSLPLGRYLLFAERCCEEIV